MSRQIVSKGSVIGALLVIVSVALLLISGCGYSGQTLMRDDIHSVAVDVFGNDTEYRTLEVELTRRLTEELRQRTSLSIKPKHEADSVLTGSLVDFDQSSQTTTKDDDVLLRRIQVTVEFRWIDNLTGQDLVPPTEFTEQNFFVLSRDEPIAPRVFRDTAETIIEKMERQW